MQGAMATDSIQVMESTTTPAPVNPCSGRHQWRFHTADKVKTISFRPIGGPRIEILSLRTFVENAQLGS